MLRSLLMNESEIKYRVNNEYLPLRSVEFELIYGTGIDASLT